MESSMSFSCLSSLFQYIERDRPLWRDATGDTWQASRIKDSIALNEVESNQTIAIQTNDSLRLCRSLVALDGHCKAIVILPESIAANVIDSLYEQAKVDCVLDDKMLNELLSTRPQNTSRPGRKLATQWILATSGTTGTPKLVQHTFSSLTQTVKFDFEKGRKHVWGSLYHLTGFAGLQVLLQAWCAGSMFVLPETDKTLQDQLSRYASAGVTALSATPSMWRKVLMTTSARELPLRQITLGGEIADGKILHALSDYFPNAKVTQIYASTEAGVGFSIRDGRAGFPESYLEDPPAGVQLKVRENRLMIAKDTLSQRFVDESVPLVEADGFVDTGDLVELVGDRYHFRGRENGAINVGGNKVQPERIEQWLVDQANVQQARVYAKSNSFTGSIVAAEIVLNTKDKDEMKSIRLGIAKQARKELASYMAPAIIRCVESIETNAAGKLKRTA